MVFLSNQLRVCVMTSLHKLLRTDFVRIIIVPIPVLPSFQISNMKYSSIMADKVAIRQIRSDRVRKRESVVGKEG